MRTPLLLATFVSLVAADPAGAASVAYTDGGNVVLASPDGQHKLPLTGDGTPDDRELGTGSRSWSRSR